MDGSGGGTYAYFPNAQVVGTVYNGADTTHSGHTTQCSTGAHSHLEFYSNHAWGAMYEWHSPQGPDHYYYNHVHGSAGDEGSYSSGNSSMSTSYIGGLLGGDTEVEIPIWDNPYHAGY